MAEIKKYADINILGNKIVYGGFQLVTTLPTTNKDGKPLSETDKGWVVTLKDNGDGTSVPYQWDGEKWKSLGSVTDTKYTVGAETIQPDEYTYLTGALDYFDGDKKDDDVNKNVTQSKVNHHVIMTTNSIYPDVTWVSLGDPSHHFGSVFGDYFSGTSSKTEELTDIVTISTNNKYTTGTVSFNKGGSYNMNITNSLSDRADKEYVKTLTNTDNTVSIVFVNTTSDNTYQSKEYNELKKDSDAWYRHSDGVLNVTASHVADGVYDHAGNTTISDMALYLTGVGTISDTVGDHERTFLNETMYMKNDVMYGEVNNYRYMKSANWNTLSGHIIKDLYTSGLEDIEISSANDTTYLENSDSTKVAYVRLGRIYGLDAQRGFNTTFILHIHSQKVVGKSKNYSNSFTCYVNVSNGDDEVKITPLFINNNSTDAGMTFLNLYTKKVATNFDGLSGTDLILEYQKSEGNNALVASALMLSDAADLYQGESYLGCFDFTYNIQLQKEWVLSSLGTVAGVDYTLGHTGVTITDTRVKGFNRSCLYISHNKPTDMVTHSLYPEVNQSDWAETDDTLETFIKNKPIFKDLFLNGLEYDPVGDEDKTIIIDDDDVVNVDTTKETNTIKVSHKTYSTTTNYYNKVTVDKYGHVTGGTASSLYINTNTNKINFDKDATLKINGDNTYLTSSLTTTNNTFSITISHKTQSGLSTTTTYSYVKVDEAGHVTTGGNAKLNLKIGNKEFVSYDNIDTKTVTFKYNNPIYMTFSTTDGNETTIGHKTVSDASKSYTKVNVDEWGHVTSGATTSFILKVNKGEFVNADGSSDEYEIDLFSQTPIEIISDNTNIPTLTFRHSTYSTVNKSTYSSVYVDNYGHVTGGTGLATTSVQVNGTTFKSIDGTSNVTLNIKSDTTDAIKLSTSGNNIIVNHATQSTAARSITNLFNVDKYGHITNTTSDVIATHKYVDELIAELNGAMIFKDTINTVSTSIFDNKDTKTGWTYRSNVSMTISTTYMYDPSQPNKVEPGDLLIAIVDDKGDVKWTIAQSNLDGTVTGVIHDDTVTHTTTITTASYAGGLQYNIHNATTDYDGLMSKTDKDNLDTLWSLTSSQFTNVQSDWNETSTSSYAYIKNKPSFYKLTLAGIEYNPTSSAKTITLNSNSAIKITTSSTAVTINHATISTADDTSATLKKIQLDVYGHVKGTANVTLTDLPAMKTLSIKNNDTTFAYDPKGTNNISFTITTSDGITSSSTSAGIIIKHDTSAQTALSNVFKKITTDNYGHITGTSNVVLSDLPTMGTLKVNDKITYDPKTSGEIALTIKSTGVIQTSTNTATKTITIEHVTPSPVDTNYFYKINTDDCGHINSTSSVVLADLPNMGTMTIKSVGNIYTYDPKKTSSTLTITSSDKIIIATSSNTMTIKHDTIGTAIATTGLRAIAVDAYGHVSSYRDITSDDLKKYAITNITETGTGSFYTTFSISNGVATFNRNGYTNTLHVSTEDKNSFVYEPLVAQTTVSIIGDDIISTEIGKDSVDTSVDVITIKHKQSTVKTTSTYNRISVDEYGHVIGASSVETNYKYVTTSTTEVNEMTITAATHKMGKDPLVQVWEVTSNGTYPIAVIDCEITTNTNGDLHLVLSKTRKIKVIVM